jgi:two-component system chemotaxis response regulator CheB
VDGVIEVLLVDDSPFIRRAVERMLQSLDEVEVVGTARNGREAIELAESLRPDVILLDIVMPEVDGLEAIEEIMRIAPTPIVVLSSHAQPGAEITLRALELGAVDFVSKSDAGTRMDIYDLAPILREKVVAAARSQVPERLEEPGRLLVEEPGTTRPVRSRYDVLLLGASTGGPRALSTILGALPATFPAGIVVAQHMPSGFTATLAERLDRRAAIHVREATDGDRVEPGVALIGVGGRQILVERGDGQLVVRVPTRSDRLLHRPSVDTLFTSAAGVVGPRAVAVILTGMGQDGAKGLEALRQAGARTFVESEESAVIYGMPRAARGSAEREYPLDRLGGVLRDLFTQEEG